MRKQDIPSRLRDQAEVSRFFDGLEPAGPGDVPFTDAEVAVYGGVARKP